MAALVGVLAHPTGLSDQFFQRGNFTTQLVELGGGGEVVRELVALGFVEVVLVLLSVVHDTALELGPPGGAVVELARRRCKTVRAKATLAFRRPLAWGRNSLM